MNSERNTYASSDSHNWHLGNFDAAELPRYQAAIERSGRNLSIRQGAYDSLGRMWNGSRYSLWCDVLEGDLTEFWAMVETEAS